MARDIPKYERQVVITGGGNNTSFATGEVKNLQLQADAMRNTAVQIEERIAENAYGQAQNTIAAEVSRIEREYPNDPMAIEEALGNFKETFFEEFNDAEVADRAMIQFDRTSLLAVERAKDGQQRIIDDQARFGALQSMDTIQREFLEVSKDIFSTNPQVSAAAQASLQETMDRLAGTLSQRDSKGMPLFTADQRFNALEQAKDAGIGGAAIAWINQQPDKDAALKTIQEGNLKLKLPDGNGGFQEISVKDSISPRALGMLESEAERQKKQIEADLWAAQEADAITQIQNQKSMTEFIQSGEASMEEKVAKINEMDLKGQVKDGFAEEARRYLSSKEKINAATDNETMANIVTRMYDMNSMSEYSEKDYLNGIQNIREDIIKQRANGKLSADDEVKLNNQLKTLTSSKVSDATQQIATSFGSARQIIDDNLPPEMRGEAVRKLFYETQKLEKGDPETGQPYTQEEYNMKARTIVDDFNKTRREKALKTVQSISQPAPAKQDETDEAVLKSKGYTMRDVSETAKKYGISEAEVIAKLKAKK